MTFLIGLKEKRGKHISICAEGIVAEGKNIAEMPEIAATSMIRPIKNTCLLIVHFYFHYLGKIVVSFHLFISS